MTSDMLQDAISLLPNDLIAATDALRARPRKTVIRWRQWAAMAACLVLVLGTGLVFYQKILPGMGGATMEMAMDYDSAAECAPQEPAAMYSNGKPTEAAAKDSADSITSDSRESPMEEAEPEEALTPTGYPADGAYFIDLSAAQICLTNVQQDSTLCIDSSQTYIFRTRESLDAYYQDWSESYYDMGSFADACAAYDGEWFAVYDLLVIRVDTEKSELVPSIASLTLIGPDACTVTITLTEHPEDNTLDPACWHILLPVEKGLLPEGTEITILLE